MYMLAHCLRVSSRAASSDDESEEEDEADRSRAESAITLEVSPSALPSAQQTVPKATKYDLTDDEDNEEEEEDAIVLPGWLSYESK